MNTEGEFRFTNGAAIDIDLSKDRINSVLMHEFTHSQTYSSTTYGQIILMLEKNELFHEKSKLFKEILFEYMNRMQERIAVNIEVMTECVKEGFSAYTTAIEKLERRNRKYYNYFRKLCCINGKVKNPQDAEQLSDILIKIATLALNVNPELIPFDKINDPKALKTYFDDPNNGAMISPNKRFDILVNVIFRNNDNNNDIENVLCGSIEPERMYDYEYIHSVAYQRVLFVIKDSPIFDRLAKRLESIGVLQFDIEDGKSLTVKPTRLNENNNIYFCKVKDRKKFNEIISELKVKEVFVQHMLGGFEEFRVISVNGYKCDKKIIWGLILFDDTQFYNMISELPCNIVFNKTKLMGKDGKSIRKMVRKLPIYVYMDTPILSALPFIRSFFFSGYYGFIDLKNHSIFVAYKRSIIFIADIIFEAKRAINTYLGENIEYIDNLNEKCDVAEVCRIDDECAEFELTRVEDLKII